MAPVGGPRGRDRGRGQERSRQSSPVQGPIRPPPVVGQQFTTRTSARQDRAKRLPHWECGNAKCRCDHNWATRMLCHLCDTPRPKAARGPKAPPPLPSVRVRQPVAPPAGPRARRPPSPAAENAQAQAPAAQAPAGPHKEAEARVKALKRDVSHLEAQAEQDPNHYEPLLLKAQSDLATATEALQRAKPVASQLQSCLSRKRQLEKSVETLGIELASLEEQVRDKKEEHEAEVLLLEAQATELRRLTLLHQEAAPAPVAGCPATAAIMAPLTPEFASNLLLSLGLLQGQIGQGLPPGKASATPTPTGGGTVTPRPPQGTITPRVDASGSATPKARSRSPSARAESAETGARPGFTIEGLVTLQEVLGLPVDDDSMSTEL